VKRGKAPLDLKARAQQLKTDIPALFLALRDPQTPPGARVLAGLAVAYALSPVDLIPDFIPVLGYLDDLLLLPALVSLAIRLIPPQVMQRARAQAQGLWAEGGPRRWYFALPALALWGLVLWLAVRHFWPAAA